MPQLLDLTRLRPHFGLEAVEQLRRRGVVGEGDLVVITKGDYVNAQGGTNTMKIVRVGSDIR